MKKNDKNWVGEMAAEVIKVVAQYAGENADVIAKSLWGEEEKTKRRSPRRKKITQDGSDE